MLPATVLPATVLPDAGVAGDGQPYLVLVYVDGTRIDRWCDERKLDADARLALLSSMMLK